MGIEQRGDVVIPNTQQEIDDEFVEMWELLTPLDEIFIQLSEEQKKRLQKLREKWEKEEQYLTTDFNGN